MADHIEFGIEAEKRAREFLQKKNYQIICTNYRYLKAEIDIIAKDLSKNEIVIVEVKARENPLIEPELAVNKKKRKLLIMAADDFICKNEIKLDTRFDIVSVEKSNNQWSFLHIEDAFLAFE